MKLNLSKPLDLEAARVSPNICEMLEERDLLKIGSIVKRGFDEDKASRQEWERKINDAIDLATLKAEVKNYPFENSANIKYPLLTTANIQFASRVYPEFIRNGRVVEVAVGGSDPDGSKADTAKRIADFMSYQLLVESDEWEENTDRMLNLLPTVGVVFKKVYFDPICKENKSIMCLHDEIIVNDNIKALETARRISHVIGKSRNEIMEMVLAGFYREDTQLIARLNADELDKDISLIEQHRWLDLDEDGYEEPYIVTIDIENNKPLRIVARFDSDGIQRTSKGQIMYIKAVNYFADFHFIPNPNGKYHSIGFGHLLFPLNSAVNTILNQLVDSGKLANLQGGFISSRVRSRDKDIRLKMGEFKILNISGDTTLQQNIFPMQYKEPSGVLFQLLGMLIQATKDLSSVTDALTGSEQAQNVPATTMLALIEQGLKVFSSIQRRLYRGFKKEFEMLFRLNRIYLDPVVYFQTMDDQAAVLQHDFDDKALDIRPIADPSAASDAQRLAKANLILQLVEKGLIDPTEGIREYLTSVEVSNIDKLMPKPKQPEPNVDLIKVQADVAHHMDSMKLQGAQLQLQQSEAGVRAKKTEAEILLTKAQAIEQLAQAESYKVQSDINAYEAQLKGLELGFDNIQAEMKSLAGLASSPSPAAPTSAAPAPQAVNPSLETGADNNESNPGAVPGLEDPTSDTGSLSPTDPGTPEPS